MKDARDLKDFDDSHPLEAALESRSHHNLLPTPTHCLKLLIRGKLLQGPRGGAVEIEEDPEFDPPARLVPPAGVSTITPSTVQGYLAHKKHPPP